MYQPRRFRFAYISQFPRIPKSRLTPWLFVIGLLMGAIVAGSPVYAASVYTDSVDYQIGSRVGITGNNFYANEIVHLEITFLDSSPLPDGIDGSWDVAADGAGDVGGGLKADDPTEVDLDGFITSWLMSSGLEPGDTLLVTATGTKSGLTASVELIVANTKFHQLLNGTPANPAWSTGAINKNNSCYSEGGSIPYRFFVLDVDSGTTHTFEVGMEATKGGIHALDYLSQYDLTEAGPISLVGGECATSPGAAPPGDCTTPVAVTALRDPRLLSSYVSPPPAEIAAIVNPSFPIDGPGDLYAYNATNVQIGQYFFAGNSTDRELHVIITFTAIDDGSVGFFWGGHLAVGHPAGWGLGQGSASVGGAPYHMYAGKLDGSGGLPNLAIQNGTLCLPPDVTLSCSSGPYCSGGTFTCSVPAGAYTYDWTVTGGSILSGQGTESITYKITAAPGDPVTVYVYACNNSGSCSNSNCCSEATAQFTAEDCCSVTITCPPEITIECDESTQPANTGNATYMVSGICAEPITISYTDTETPGTCAQEKTISRLWKATDNNGQLRAQCTQTIHVVDDTAPVLTDCPGPVTVECNNIPAPATPKATDNCDPNPVITMTETTVPGSCDQEYVLTRTWTATDACGNSSSCSQDITVHDTQPPTISCPQPITVECGDPVPAPNPGLITAADACDPSPVVTWISDVSDNQTCPETISRTYRATDGCGNYAECVQQIIIDDTTPPQVTCPAAVTVECLADVPDPNLTLVSATDDCDPSPVVAWVSDEIAPGVCPKVITRTYKATDFCDNVGTCTQIITIDDTTPPQITCPPNTTIYCGESSDPSHTGYATATDNCSAVEDIEVTYNDVTNGGAITRTWTATDECGNQASCVQTILTPPDTTPPEITCPDPVTVDCLEDVPPPAPATVIVFDACDPTPVVTHVSDVQDGTECPITITRTYRATDASGNWDVCVQTITVDDQTPPQITCPGPITVECMSDVPAPNPALVTATDNCDAIPVVTFVGDVPSGTGCPLTITRTYKATDYCGNEAFCTQIITVNDETPPQITCPGPITVECIGDVPSPNPALVTASDNCGSDPVVEWVSDDPQGTCPVIITRVYKATDDCDNVSYCQQTITVDDQTPPQVTCPGSITVECMNEVPAPNTALVTTTDNCDPAPVVTFVSDVPSGSGCPMTITRTYKATDFCNNEAFCTQTITVDDQTAPQVTCPDPVTVECMADVPAPNPGMVTAFDNCDPDPVVEWVSDDPQGTCPTIITRLYRATDDCNNVGYCQQIITIDDQTPPQLTCPDPVTVNCLADVPAPNPALVTATDNCDPSPVVSFVSDQQTGSGCPIIITRTYRAVDVCDNEGFCTQTITVQDNTPPQITCPGPVTVECVADVPPPNIELVTATDNCDSDPTVEFVGDDYQTQGCPGQIIRTYKATDVCGNEAFCTQTITLDDQTPPVFTGFPGDFGRYDCEPSEVCLPVAASDNCQGDVVLTVVSGPGSIVDGEWCYTPTGSIVIDVTIRASDECDNYVEDTFHLDYRINQRPTITNCPQDATIHWGETYTVDIDATDPDQGQALTFSLCPDPPPSVTIDANTGQVQFASTADDICDPAICVIVTDECDAADTCEFNVCVYNDPPVITCPEDQVVCYGNPFEGQITAVDPDQGPYQFFYLISGPIGLTVDANTGAILWPNPAPGAWEICVLVTDSAATCDPCSPANADTCCFTLNVVSLDLVIEKVHDQIQGQYTEVSIDFMNQGGNWPIGGYDLLIQYDNSALAFQQANPGKFFTDCAWEYFTYRFGPSGNCGVGACPSGVLRIVAMAETTGGNLAEHPDCYTNDGVADPGPGSTTSTQLAVMTFLVSNDRTLECQYVPIRFVWYDCGDNSLSNVSGDTLFISNHVYDYGGETGDPPTVIWNEITGLDNAFPTVTGAVSPACDISDKFELVRCANFYNGGIDIICADSIDAPGDINLNGISYEIADAVMLTNYFITGLAAFGGHIEGSIAASDVNRDGVPLSVADLVYIIRVVVGDALPYAKDTPLASVSVAYAFEAGEVSVSGGVDIGGAALLVRGTVVPELLVDGMDLAYAYDGGNTRIIVTPDLDAASMHSFRGAFLRGIDGELISIELATSEGVPVVAKNVPTHYRLDQNYPNPFNPVTTLRFALPEAVDYRLTIYNIQGRVVEVIHGRAEAPGVYRHDWNASAQASGVYLYRLDAGEFSQTRKMLLLK